MDEGEWKRKLVSLCRRHVQRDCVASNALVLALAELWEICRSAPPDLELAFRSVGEAELQFRCTLMTDELERGRLNWSSRGDWNELARSLGGQMRALDEVLAGRPRSIVPPSDPLQYLCKELDVFVIPRKTPKQVPAHGGPGRGFGRAATPRHRLIARRLDSFEIKLCWEPQLGLGRSIQGIHKLGAALLPGMRLEGDCVNGDWHPTGATCADEVGYLKTQLEGIGREPLLAAAWPELAMPPPRLQLLAEGLRRDLLTTKLGHGPAFIAAGSWYVQTPGGTFSEMPILDRTGRVRIRYRKSLAYVSALSGTEGEAATLREGIVEDRTIPVLINEDALVTFAICADFCEQEVRGAFPYRDLDVDLVVVVSHGNRSTMNGHEGNAAQIRNRWGTRTFVVQHNDAPSGPAGWVYPPGDGQNLEVREPWSTRDVRFR
jgi:hypothetical protein